MDKQIREGKRAAQLLDDPLLKQAFEDLLETYKQEIFNTNFADDDKRKSLWMAYNMLDKIRGHLQSIMESGKLASPIQAGISIGATQPETYKTKWQYGDNAPAENAWRKSSSYRFAEQIAKCLGEPGKYAGLMFDTSRIKKSTIGQYTIL